jgi:hypothetical protein
MQPDTRGQRGLAGIQTVIAIGFMAAAAVGVGFHT